MLPQTTPPVGKNPIGMAARRPTSKALMHTTRCLICSMYYFVFQHNATV